MDEILVFFVNDIGKANWTGILFPLLVGWFGWGLGRWWAFIKSIRNKELRSFIGNYYAYHLVPYTNGAEVKETKARIYRGLSGLIKISIKFPNSKRKSQGFGYSIQGAIYFKLRDADQKYEETMVFKNSILQSQTVFVGVYSGLTKLQDPCCGMQLLSSEPVTPKDAVSILNSKDLVVTSEKLLDVHKAFKIFQQ